MAIVALLPLLLLLGTLAVSNAQVPTIESSSHDITISAPGGAIQINAKGCNIGSDEICQLQQDLATMTNQMLQLQTDLQSTTDKLSTAVASLAMQTDTDDNTASVGSYTKFVLDRVSDLPTQTFTDATYVAKADASKFAQQSDLETVAANQVTIQQNLLDFEKEIKKALAKVENATKIPDIPFCEAFASGDKNLVVDSLVEHVAGTTVSLSCKPLAKLIGSNIATCLSNGSWHTKKTPNCQECESNWLDINCDVRDFTNFTGSASATGIDLRSGNPRVYSTAQLAPFAADGAVFGISFSYQYVNGYGIGGNHNYANWFVYIVDTDNFSNRVKVYDSKAAGQEMSGYPYDNCCQRVNTCWGNKNDPHDGCYSPQIKVNVENSKPILNAERAYVLFEWDNQDRNVHINDDGMEMKVKTLRC